MNDPNDPHRIEPLEARLARARSETPTPELGADWRAGVMEAVRAHGPHAAAERDLPLGRLVGRGFFTAAAAAAVTALYVFGRGFDPTGELTRVITGDPATLLQILLIF